MKYFRVNGGDIFPFSIPKITSRDVRLLEKCDMQKKSFFPAAEQNLRAVQSACEGLVKAFGLAYSTEICLCSHTTRVTVFLPVWQLSHKEWCLFRQLEPHLAGITVRPFGFGLKIFFKIKYFGDEAECVEKDLEEILLHYTEKNVPL